MRRALIALAGALACACAAAQTAPPEPRPDQEWLFTGQSVPPRYDAPPEEEHLAVAPPR